MGPRTQLHRRFSASGLRRSRQARHAVVNRLRLVTSAAMSMLRNAATCLTGSSMVGSLFSPSFQSMVVSGQDSLLGGMARHSISLRRTRKAVGAWPIDVCPYRRMGTAPVK